MLDKLSSSSSQRTNGNHQVHHNISARDSLTVITGGAGFIGSNLADRLLNEGNRVLLIDRLSRPGVEKNVEWLSRTHGSLLDIEVVDVRNITRLRKLLNGATHVFHLAAQVAVTSSLIDPVDDFQTNAWGTLNMLEAIRTMTSPPSLVLTSTNKVYGNLEHLGFVKNATRYIPTDPALASKGISESVPLNFHSPYGCSKGAADQYVIDYARTYKLPALVFRMSCIYGPHQYGNEDQGWVAHFLINSLLGKPITIYGDGMQVRDILFVDDLIDAFLLAQHNIDRTAGHAFNIGGGPSNTISLLELLDLISELNPGDYSIRFEDWRAADQRFYVTDTSKFQSLTDWKPVISVKEGIRRLLHWLSTDAGIVQALPVSAVPVNRFSAGVPLEAISK